MTAALVAIERSLPHPEPLRLLRAQVLNSLAAENSRRNYGKALDEFFAFWSAKSEPLSPALVMEYRAQLLARQLAPPTINVRLSAVRKLVSEARRNGWIDAELAAAVTETPNVRQQGTRIGNWLTRVQAKEILCIPDRETLKGKRD